ncbi:MAG: hypothetical protein K1X44_02270 [Alphaproteobacteria bacterium]|nr:hypothetical protein [Alphaproteobacteria bacterium]
MNIVQIMSWVILGFTIIFLVVLCFAGLWLFAFFVSLIALIGRIILWPLLRVKSIKNLETGPILHEEKIHKDVSESKIMQATFLKISLDQEGQVIDGFITSGPEVGSRLSELKSETLQTLLNYYRTHDNRSAFLLSAYLDKQKS